ncbi:MAG TPA: porin family protein [Cytophaga sp.]|jgi:hypothetical protein|nr:porin family protein [Cytophaga sp.]
MKQFLLFIYILFSTAVFSQQNKLDIGFIGGPNASYLRASASNSKIYPKIGFYAGLSAQYNFNKYCALHTEIAFEKKGCSERATFLDANGNIIGDPKFAFQYNCLTIPVLFRVSFGKKVKFFLNAGPYVSYLVNAEYKNIFGYNNPDGNYNETSYLHKMDAGITHGLGILIPVHDKLYASCELRDNFGVVGLFKSTPYYSNSQSYNYSLGLLFGLTYKFGK